VVREGAEPFSVSVNDYFAVGGKLLVARLIFWVGDPDADKYIGVLHDIVGTLRAP